MGVFTDIQVALDQRLNTTSGLPAVAWENLDFTPTKGTSFVRPTNLSADGQTISIGDRLQSLPGIYQVDVFTDVNQGAGALNTVCDSIRDHFNSVDTLTEGTTEVWLQSINRIPPERDEAWLRGSVIINYIVYST